MLRSSQQTKDVVYPLRVVDVVDDVVVVVVDVVVDVVDVVVVLGFIAGTPVFCLTRFDYN